MFFIGKTKRGDTGRVIGRSRKIRMISTGAFCLLALYALLAVFPIVRHKDEAEATTVPATTTLSIISSKDTASVDITPTSGTGTFATSAAADQAQFSVTTDNLTGYSVTLLGSDTSGQLVNAVTGDTLDTITADTTENDFRTGSASTYANKWGYRLNVNGTTTTNFMAAPTTSTAKTIYSTNAPNVTTDNYTLALGARIDYEKPAGTYTNTFVLTAVGNPISYQIDYIDNYDGTSTLLEQDANSNITASEFIISATNPTRSGAIFKGWCYGTVDHTVNPSSCTGTVYQSGDTFTFTSLPSSGTATAELYAMWDMGITMQNMNPDLCKTSAPTVVKDARDGQEYMVQRLADGNCWLLDNLRLDLINTSLNDLKGKTNATDQSLTYLKNGGGSSPYTTSAVSNTWSGNLYTTAQIYTTKKDDISVQTFGVASGKIGVMYNICAASAGSYCYASGSSSGNVTQDVCPAGWKMGASDTSNGSFYYLLNTGYSGNWTNFRNALSTPMSGNYIASYGYQNSDSSGVFGDYWGSTRYNGSSQYWLYVSINNSSSNARSNYPREYGFAVRCVMKDTMQSFTSQQAGAMATGETKTLEDERDGQTYTVAKLGDGNVWMTRNLAIGCNGTGSTYGSGYSQKTLTSADSNVSTSYTTSNVTLAGKSDSYDNDYITCDSTYGAYYNYAAATAGTITGSSNSDPQVYDVCPKGWRLPTSSEWSAITTYKTQFNPQLGGNYYGGSIRLQSFGYWWLSTEHPTNPANRYEGWYQNGAANLDMGAFDRGSGFEIRCIKSDDDLPTMQSVTDAQLQTLLPNIHDTMMLKDVRDGKKYKVGRLADGNVWMVASLNLAGGTTLNADTSDVPTDGYYTLPASSSTGFSNNTTAYVYNTGNETTNQADCNTSPGCNSYYSWLAATAGGKDASGNAVIDKGSDAAYSICPKGWRLPKSGNRDDTSATSTTGYKKGDFYKLATAYGANLESSYYQNSAVFYNNAGPGTLPNFLLAGYYDSGSFNNGGSYGYYWSSSSSSSTNAHLLYFDSSNVYSAHYLLRRRGYSVRCIKDDERDMDDITTMQQMNPQIANNTTDGDTKTLVDTRDNQEYTVKKINGRIWMTRNLAIGCDGTGSTYGSGYSAKTLTTINSDLTTNFTTPTTPVNTNNYTTPLQTCSDTYGAWYNYAATTAGTITGSSNTTPASRSICPAGWKLATADEQSTVVGYASDFNLVGGGRWWSGSLGPSASVALWWGASDDDGSHSGVYRYHLSTDMTDFVSSAGTSRDAGGYIRCIAR